jgi:hypothetical protein
VGKEAKQQQQKRDKSKIEKPKICRRNNNRSAVMWLKGGGCDVVELLKAEAGLLEEAL